jgi:FixJ family two-component response regulator
MTSSPCVHIVDDDESMRTSLARLLSGEGYPISYYASAEALLEVAGPLLTGCILLDLRLPGINGLELQAVLQKRGCLAPVVFLTAHGDVTAGVLAMKAGAVDFLEKPVSADALFAAVSAAFNRDAGVRRQHQERAEAQALVDTLSDREREIWLRVVKGQLNKQIAYDLGVVERTVKIYRRSAMQKLRASSVADLVRIADRLATRD